MPEPDVARYRRMVKSLLPAQCKSIQTHHRALGHTLYPEKLQHFVNMPHPSGHKQCKLAFLCFQSREEILAAQQQPHNTFSHGMVIVAYRVERYQMGNLCHCTTLPRFCERMLTTGPSKASTGRGAPVYSLLSLLLNPCVPAQCVSAMIHRSAVSNPPV